MSDKVLGVILLSVLWGWPCWYAYKSGCKFSDLLIPLRKIKSLLWQVLKLFLILAGISIFIAAIYIFVEFCNSHPLQAIILILIVGFFILYNKK